MKFLKTLLVIAVMIVGFAPSVYSVQLPHYLANAGGTPLTHQYGDFYSYSLPVLEYLRSNGLIPGTSYSVQSSSGHIKNDIVSVAMEKFLESFTLK